MTEQSSIGSDGEEKDPEVPPDLFAVKIAVTPETITELLARFALDVGDRPHVEPAPDGRGTLYAFAPEGQIRELRDAGYHVEVGENASETGRQRMDEVAEGDRFDGGRIPPTGLGTKAGRDPGRDPGRGGAR